jgi:hypothetical protein
MAKKAGRLTQFLPVRTAWPIVDVIEMFAGDFAILTPSAYLSKDQEENFQKLYTQCIQDGYFCKSDWVDWCTATRIPFRPKMDTSSMICAESIIDIRKMSDMCEDVLPHIGSFVEERIWGPLATYTHTPNQRILAGAIASTLPLLKHQHCALSKIGSQSPIVSKEIYNSLTAHYRTPTMIWKKNGRSAIPLLPLGTQYVPPIVENLDDISSDIFIAKILQTTKQQYIAHCVFEIPEKIALDTILSRKLRNFLYYRILIEWFRYRRHSYTICYEDILRERADIIYRSSCEYILEKI